MPCAAAAHARTPGSLPLLCEGVSTIPNGLHLEGRRSKSLRGYGRRTVGSPRANRRRFWGGGLDCHYQRTVGRGQEQEGGNRGKAPGRSTELGPRPTSLSLLTAAIALSTLRTPAPWRPRQTNSENEPLPRRNGPVRSRRGFGVCVKCCAATGRRFRKMSCRRSSGPIYEQRPLRTHPPTTDRSLCDGGTFE